MNIKDTKSENTFIDRKGRLIKISNFGSGALIIEGVIVLEKGVFFSGAYRV